MSAAQKIFDSVSGAWIAAGSFVLAAFLLSRIEVSKIKINPWTALRKAVGNFFVKEHIEKINALEERFDCFEELLRQHILDSDRRAADKARRHILSFEREIQFDVRHSKEEFEDILETIRHYETYCDEHEDYKNHIANESAAHIREVYRDRLRKHDFATQGGQQA